MDELLLEFLEKENLKVPKTCFINVSIVQQSLCVLFNDKCVKYDDCSTCLLCADHIKKFMKFMESINFKKNLP